MPITEDQVTELYGEGARIHSIHHRPRPEQSVFASTMSSNASVDTTVGSTAALIHSHAAKVKKKKYAFLRQGNGGQQAAANNRGYTTGRHYRDNGLHHGQKELNILLATPTVPNFIDQMRKKKQAIDQVSAKRLSSDDDDDDDGGEDYGHCGRRSGRRAERHRRRRSRSRGGPNSAGMGVGQAGRRLAGVAPVRAVAVPRPKARRVPGRRPGARVRARRPRRAPGPRRRRRRRRRIKRTRDRPPPAATGEEGGGRGGGRRSADGGRTDGREGG